MNSPSDRGRRLASMSPSPTVSAGRDLAVVGLLVRRRRRIGSFVTQHRQRRAQRRRRVRLRLVGEHLVGGFLGLLERKAKSDKGFHHRAAHRVAVDGRQADGGPDRRRPCREAPAPSARRCACRCRAPGSVRSRRCRPTPGATRARRARPAWPARSSARRRTPTAGSRTGRARRSRRSRTASSSPRARSSRSPVAPRLRGASVDSVDGVALTRYPTPHASMTTWSSATSRTSPRMDAIIVPP